LDTGISLTGSRSERCETVIELDELYVEWLYSHVGVSSDKNPRHSYWLLTEVLHQTQFTWSVPNDDNRASDGMALRDDFCDEVGSWGDNENVHNPCTLFEMLIALAQRADYISEGMGIAEGVGGWFWVMIKNLGLTEYNDDVLAHCGPSARRHIQGVVGALIDRKYKFNGDGGLFPIENPQKDQRHVEIWYQLSSYINERDSP
jgi:hypothetical protein